MSAWGRRLVRHAERAELAARRLQCRRTGHLWDSERPKGAIHAQDICWRCDQVRGESS